ncbi:hypothetical protein ACU4HD_43005 [Cupriavidus basilensis]
MVAALETQQRQRAAPATSNGAGEQYLVRAPGQVESIDDIREIIVGSAQGQPDPHPRPGRR